MSRRKEQHCFDCLVALARVGKESIEATLRTTDIATVVHTVFNRGNCDHLSESVFHKTATALAVASLESDCARSSYRSFAVCPIWKPSPRPLAVQAIAFEGLISRSDRQAARRNRWTSGGEFHLSMILMRMLSLKDVAACSAAARLCIRYGVGEEDGESRATVP